MDSGKKGFRSVPNIVVATPFSGKRECFFEYRRGLRHVLKETGAKTFYLYDNSKTHAFKRRLLKLKAELEKAGVTVLYHKDTSPIAVAYPVFMKMHSVYTKIFSEIPQDTDYLLIIEDDIECVSKTPITKMLVHFDDPTVGIVSPCCFSRHVRRTQIWNKVNGQLSSVNPSKGTQEVDTVSNSFWLCRMSMLREVGFHYECEGYTGVDRATALAFRQKGYKVLVDWNLHTMHYGVNKQGFFMAHGIKIPHDMRLVTYELKSHSTPIFVRVPAISTALDVEKAFNKKVVRRIDHE